MDQLAIAKSLREKGKVTIKEGNGKVIKLLKTEAWNPDMGIDWIYLIFDLFQIRSICQPFSEVSLDIVEFGSKPTIYHSPVSRVIENGPIQEGLIQFALIREPNWNKLLFQISNPVLAAIDPATTEADFQTDLYFPLFSPSTKEMYLGPEGEVKIISR